MRPPRRTPPCDRAIRRAVAACGLLVAVAVCVAWGHAPDPTTVASHVHLDARPLDASPGAARRLLVVAHNAGDARATVRLARAHHADGIEIDVRLEQHELLATHSTPRAADLGTLRTLATAWAELPSTTTVLLDVKTSSVATADLLAAAIAHHPTTRVLASTPDVDTLARLAARAPQVLRLRTTRSPGALAAVLADPGPAQGVSIPVTLLTDAILRALHERGLWVQAYPVDSLDAANRLADRGVDGITTDSLTIMAALPAAARAGAGATATP